MEYPHHNTAKKKKNENMNAKVLTIYRDRNNLVNNIVEYLAQNQRLPGLS